MVINETMSYFARNAKRDDGNKRDNGIFWKYLEVRRWENLSETMVYFEKLIKMGHLSKFIWLSMVQHTLWEGSLVTKPGFS